MREHAIPQDITGYRFHIIGNMTLRQFVEVAAGVVIAVIIYNTNLISIVKYPLIGLFVGIGAAIAFVPIQERPLDHWISTFIKILYKPTKFYWKKRQKIPDPFLYQKNKKQVDPMLEVDLSPARRQRINDFLTSIDQVEVDPWEISENKKIGNILQVFRQVSIDESQIEIKKIKVEKPILEVRPRKLKNPNINYEETIVFEQDELILDNQLSNAQVYEEKIPLAKRGISSSNDVATQIKVPELELISIKDNVFDGKTNTPEIETISSSDMVFARNQQQIDQNAQKSQQAITNINLPFPSKPKDPNKIVGMVLSPNSNLITNAIVEIKTTQGQIVRAVKTNALGQFFITTPLGNGSYHIDVEKQDHQFTTQTLQLNGSIVEPLEIRSLN